MTAPVKSIAIRIILLCAALRLGAAATLPPEKLLPSSTLVVITVPDLNRAKAAADQDGSWLLMKDPVMKPFLDKFVAKWNLEVVTKVEKQFGLKLADYTDLAQGQITLGLLSPRDPEQPKARFPFIFLLDAGSKSDQLKTRLEDFRKRWVDSGKKLRMDKVRGVEFATLVFTGEELEKALDQAFPGKKPNEDDDDKPKGKNADAKGDSVEKYEWLIGQSESLLVIGNSAAEVEHLLALQAGAGGGALAEVANFSGYQNNLFRDSSVFAWANLQDVVSLVKKSMATADSNRRGGAEAGPNPVQLMEGLGLGGLKAFAYGMRSGPEGVAYDLRIAAPESERKGLLKMLFFEGKDASPPPFVPADVLSFSRSRVDMLRAFETLESTITQVFPPSAGVIKMFMDTTGKDKDPNFDLRKNLFGNLGDDYVSYSRAPRERTLENLNKSPSLHLIGSRDAEQLMTALKTLSAFLPSQAAKKEREFLGKKITSITFPGSTQPMSFASSGGYLAISSDDAMLEEYLRSAEQKTKPLREVNRLADDAQKVKGMATGMFGYVDGVESARLQFEVLKKESGAFANLIGAIPFAARLGFDEDTKSIKEWVDFSLLPSFDQVSKYFNRAVYSGVFSAEGFELRFFAPTPPTLKK